VVRRAARSRRAYERGPKLRRTVAHKGVGRTLVAQRTAAVGHNQVAARPRLMAGCSPEAIHERTAAADNWVVAHRTRAVGHNHVAPDKCRELLYKLVADRTQAEVHGEGLCRKRIADRTPGAAYGRVAPHKHAAPAQNRAAAGTRPGLQQDQEMRPRRAALPR